MEMNDDIDWKINYYIRFIFNIPIFRNYSLIFDISDLVISFCHKVAQNQVLMNKFI